MKTKTKKLLFIFTLLFFLLGFINIHFSVLGLICMFLPFFFLFRDKKKTWCQSYCPRASLYSVCGKATKGKKTPKFFTKGNMKWLLLTYFGVSLMLIILTTIRVATGAMAPLEQVRFLIFVPVTDNLPQLFTIENIPGWITHFSYRFYSMMMTTTILGLIMAFVYKPRTWCTVCPISTISAEYLKSNKKS